MVGAWVHGWSVAQANHDQAYLKYARYARILHYKLPAFFLVGLFFLFLIPLDTAAPSLPIRR